METKFRVTYVTFKCATLLLSMYEASERPIVKNFGLLLENAAASGLNLSLYCGTACVGKVAWLSRLLSVAARL